MTDWDLGKIYDMRVLGERLFVYALLLAGITFVADRVGPKWVFLDYAFWVCLVGAAIGLVLRYLDAGTIKWTGNPRLKQAIGWFIAAAIALIIYSLNEKGVQDAMPFLKASKKIWKSFAPITIFLGPLFALLGVNALQVGTVYDERLGPSFAERVFCTNINAKIAAIPMALTALGVFVGATLWTVYHSFTRSKLLPKSDFVGFDQYDRLWNTERWHISIENLAIYGFFSMIFSLTIGFILAALLDQKIRFENTFRTILLYPFALSFIVTGLVWQWILNPDFGVQKIVRSLGFEDFVFDPLFNADIVIYGILIAGLWQGTGFIMCLMLAGLRGIDEEIWKAARVDGIPMWKTYLFIIIPMMRPVFITTLVIIASGIVRVYDLVVAQTSGGPGLASEVPAKYVYDYMFGGQNLGQGFAASTMMLLSVLVIVIPWAFLEFSERRNAR